MAEIIAPQKGGKRKTPAPRIDLTPMVDLGFLLITFFMFTTTLAKPKTMELNMPTNEPVEHPSVVIAESTITLVAVRKHQIIYYEGILSDPTQLIQCPISQIRDMLLKKKNEVASLPATFSAAAHQVYVLIKPGNDCTYGDVVELLDEMNITDISHYTIMDINPDEKNLIQKIL